MGSGGVACGGEGRSGLRADEEYPVLTASVDRLLMERRTNFAYDVLTSGNPKNEAFHIKEDLATKPPNRSPAARPEHPRSGVAGGATGAGAVGWGAVGSC
jgi:hypothetical protein